MSGVLERRAEPTLWRLQRLAATFGAREWSISWETTDVAFAGMPGATGIADRLARLGAYYDWAGRCAPAPDG